VPQFCGSPAWVNRRRFLCCCSSPMRASSSGVSCLRKRGNSTSPVGPSRPQDPQPRDRGRACGRMLHRRCARTTQTHLGAALVRHVITVHRSADLASASTGDGACHYRRPRGASRTTTHSTWRREELGACAIPSARLPPFGFCSIWRDASLRVVRAVPIRCGRWGGCVRPAALDLWECFHDHATT
jgi:hypothetical protein